MVVKRIRVLGPQETLIHAAPEVRCNDCYNRPCVSKVFVQLLWLCCAHRSVLWSLCCAATALLFCADRSAVTYAGLSVLTHR